MTENDVIKSLEKARGAKANVLVPTTRISGLSELHAPVIDEVYLSPDPAEGDVYHDYQTKKYRLTKQGLHKLSVVAGIEWHPLASCRTDNMCDRDYISFRAVGGVRKADGKLVPVQGSYDIDFQVLEETLLDQYPNTYKKQEWFKKLDEGGKRDAIARAVRRDMLFKRKHKLAICETGAMNRVIRSLLGLKGSYTPAELKKPFVMVRIVLKPDYSDPDIKKAMIEKALSSTTGLYGDATTQQPVIDIPSTPAEIPEAIEVPAEDKPKKETKPGKMEFSDFTEEDQAEQIAGLIVKKAFQYADLPAVIKKNCDDTTYLTVDFLKTLGNATRLNFYNKLNTLPDDDIPF